MLKKLFCLFWVVLLISCTEEEKPNFIVQGNIKGLKKGTVYLQKVVDSSYVTLDSVSISGDSNFTFTSDLKEPELMFLRLNKNDDDDESAISFFADTGTTTINSSLKNYIFDAKIEGSRHQKLLEEYLAIMYRFNDENLELIKKSLEARSSKDSIGIQQIETEFDNLLKRKYRYTINFAFANNDSEVSPYLAVYEIPDANTKYLDTIYGSLSNKVKESKYGKQLKYLISKRKEQ